MKTIAKGKILQRLISTVLIILMLSSYFPMFVFAEETNEENLNEYVQFDIYWENAESDLDAETDIAYAFDYNIKLSGSKTGFKNLEMRIENEETKQTPIAKITSIKNSETINISEGNGYSIVEFGNKDTIEFVGSSNVVFRNDGIQYDKVIVVTLEGEHEKGEFKIVKRLNANVTPKKEVTNFLSLITHQTTENGTAVVEKVYADEWVDLSDYNLGRDLGYTTSVTAIYPIHIDSYTYTQKMNLDVTINRITDNVGKLITGYEIDWGELIDEFGQPKGQNENEDGSVTFRFEKGTDSEEFKEDNTFSLNKDFTISIKYNIPNENPLVDNEVNTDLIKEWSTICKLDIKMKSIGYEVEKEYNKEEIVTIVEKDSFYKKQNKVGVAVYREGNHEWNQYDLRVEKSGSSNTAYLYTEEMEQFIENRYIDLHMSAHVSEISARGIKEYLRGKLVFKNPKITYISESGEEVTKVLNGEQIRLKSIEEYSKYGNTEIAYNNLNENIKLDNASMYKYDIPEDVNISEFEIYLDDYLTYRWNAHFLVYTLNADKLGLTDNEIKNIVKIDFNMESEGDWMYGDGDVTYYNVDSIGNTVSYFEYDIGDSFNSDIGKLREPENKEVTIKMFKNENVIRTKELKVVNENPVFYVKLPSEFSYRNVKVSISDDNEISINKYKSTRINNENYIVIECNGTYDSSKIENVDIKINFVRTLQTTSSVGNIEMVAYMLTDNESYFYESSNDLKLAKKGKEPSGNVFKTVKKFEISASKTITANTKIYVDNIEYVPTPSNDIDNWTEKLKPLIISSNKKVTYSSEIESSGEDLKNIVIISRLPIANNKYFDGSDILENPYKLPDSFYEEYKEKIKGITSDKTIYQVSLQNLSNIKVYKDTTLLNSDEYTIYYSTEELVDIDNGNFNEYIESDSNIVNAKNLKIVLNENFKLLSGERIRVQYDMTMPDEAGMVGATTAVRYTKDNNGTEDLYSPIAYVINGDTKGTINVQKTFQGLATGVAPEGESLEGIEFKLEYYDEETGANKFLQDSEGIDIIATTDASGVATFTQVPYGEYYLYEVTEFANYDNECNLEIIDLEPACTVNYTRENPIKKGTIVINKTWDDINEQPETVKFTIERTTNDTINYPATTIETNKNGVATLYNAPYGEYKITEAQGVAGWVMQPTEQTITLNQSVAETDVTNVLGKGTLKIVKTVPQGESVEGLTFQITGLGMVSYTNKNGEEVMNNTDLTIKIGEDYSANNDITVTLSENNTKATITLSNVYLGLYTVEEIEIPIIDGTDIEKYVAASDSIHLVENGKIETVTLKNEYKRGTLEINKTAKLKEGDTYTEIGDLSQFKIRVYGTSYYGNEINTTISLDENGYGSATLEIGEYKIEEIGAEGYTLYYGKDSTASTESPTITINHNKTITQDLYNEHTGVGYVRVEKTLEGKTDAQKVLDAGIEFKVVGQNVAGGRVEETIKIDKIDTEKNVAYGVSNAISAGGEYQLEEVETTVPNYYEAIEPMAIEINSAHTAETPLVINAENKRGRGNLEILTKTEPVGGPLVGITYNVTEVEINENGTYTKVGDATYVEGSNETINPSFAELEDIYAGYYLVEQLTVPAGWEKDVPQIVEVPSYNIGYANFEITKTPTLKTNRVIISKEILNSKNEIASSQDFANAKLSEDENFEVKITNVDTQEVYYTFISKNEPGIIKGLDAGSYEIEEVYKPKYITQGYYITSNGLNADTGMLENVENALYPVDGNKYIFTIEENENDVLDINIKIKNIINTDFGFGGQTQKENYSKFSVEEDIKVLTKTIIYVVDEENNAISGAKFKLLNEAGKEMKLKASGTEFEIDDRKLIITGLPVGKYTLVNTAYPDGYLKPDDKDVVVYQDAVQVARVEIQKNIPRGSLTLSTVYRTAEDETNYVPRSKYKVVNKETGELVTFARTATGDYKKTNLEGSSPIIMLKSGAIEVEGLEVGEYEVGIVDVYRGYGIQSELPEIVTVKQNVSENVSVEVVDKEIVQVVAGYGNNMYLDESGDLYVWGDNFYGVFANGTMDNGDTSRKTKIEFGENVKITKVVQSTGGMAATAIDSDGRVWSWGYNSNRSLGVGDVGEVYEPTFPIALSEEYNNGTRFVDVEIGDYTNIILDNKGRIWACGEYKGDGDDDAYNSDYKHICISEIEGTALAESYAQGITIKKLGKYIGTYDYNCFAAIDSLGRVWVWGYNMAQIGTGNGYSTLTPVCISETSDLKNVKIENVTMTNRFSLAVDEDGNLWMWGVDSTVLAGTIGGTKIVPTKVDSAIFGDSKIKTAIGTSYTSAYAMVVDEFGRVWTWGTDTSGQLGYGEVKNSQVPVCISDDETEILYGVEIEDIDIGIGNGYSNYKSDQHILAVDKNNKLWCWGGYSNSYDLTGPISTTPITTPRNIYVSYDEHLEYNLRFKEVFTNNYSQSSFAIDEEGKLWVWGRNYNYELGITIGYPNPPILTPMIIDIPGDPKMIKVSSCYEKTIFLSEDGRVFVSGSNNSGIIADGIEEYTNYLIYEITKKFNLNYDEKIVDICSAGSFYIAIDNKGRVYTWGYPDYIGKPNAENSYLINCISNDDEVLKDVNIVKVSSDSNQIELLDNMGKVYSWGGSMSSYSKTPVCITDSNEELRENYYNNGIKIVDINGAALLDSNGRIWVILSDSIFVSDDATSSLYKYYEVDNNYKVTKLYSNQDGNVIFKDSNNVLWYMNYWSSGGPQIEKLQTALNVKTELMPKDIISLSGHLLIDAYGQIWTYQNVSNSSGEAGTGTTTPVEQPICLSTTESFNSNNALVNTPIYNALNGIKIQELVNDNFAIDENGNVWYFGDGINPININEQFKGDENPMYGKGVSRVINSNYIITTDNEIWYIGGGYPAYIMDAMSIECEYIEENYSVLNNEYYIALDKDGKIWACGSLNGMFGISSKVTTPVCINEIEDSELCIEHQKDTTFGIAKMFKNSYGYIALDNKGKVWSWGNYGGLGTGTTEAVVLPKCISNIESTELCNQYADSNFKIVDISNNKLIDSYGKVWSQENYSSKLFECISNITTSDLYLEHQNSSDFGITKISAFSGGQGYYFLIGNNGKVYSNYSGTYTNVSGLTGITDIVPISTVSYGNYTGYKHIAYGADGIYTVEYKSNSTTPTVSKKSSSKIKKLITIYDDYTVMALDETGKIWFFGYANSYTPSGMELSGDNNAQCLSENTNFALYDVEISNIECFAGTVVAETADGELYAWGQYAKSTPELFTHCDEIVTAMLGEEPNNENKVKVLEMLDGLDYVDEELPDGTWGYVYEQLYIKENDLYTIRIAAYLPEKPLIVSNTNTCLTHQYLGKGIVEEVLDSQHVKTTNGFIWKISENGEVSQVTNYTPSTEEPEEITPVEIEGVNIVKQTKYKALDDKGNLYVWDKYTGFTSAKEGITCITTTEYDVEPIYSHTNGWSVIKAQF